MGFPAMILILAISRQAEAAVFYISPAGSDANTGVSAAAPWKTFAFATPKLNPGDSLILLDGTYTLAGSGAANINCSTTHKNGTATARITVRAQNERKAFLSGDGLYTPFYLQYCGYWTIEGLRVQSRDAVPPNDANGNPIRWIGGPTSFYRSHHLVIRRMLVAYNNRYTNSALMALTEVNDSLIEENEFYWFHRHAMTPYGATTRNIFRRNYCNSRTMPDIPGGWNSGGANGDSCIEAYPSDNTILENNVSEGNGTLVTIMGINVANNNRFLGNISMNDGYGFVHKQRPEFMNNPPTDNLVKDGVVINPTGVGVYFRGTRNSRCENCSIFAAAGKSAFIADQEGGLTNTGLNSAYVLNSLMTGGGLGAGFYAQSAWGAEFNNASTMATPYYPDDAHITSKNTSSPGMGTCRVWVPDSSPLKRAGKNGADIGANILYRYQNGVLTNEPLWDRTTGKFPCGALVPGINDVAGSSCIDVHARLNVNANGCPFPAGYGGGIVTANPAPSAVRNAKVK